MFGDDLLPPEFPSELGQDAGVRFVKDGQEYRIMRYDDDTWLIHKAGAEREHFELILTTDGHRWTLEGRNGMVFLGAMGVTKGEVFGGKFF